MFDEAAFPRQWSPRAHHSDMVGGWSGGRGCGENTPRKPGPCVSSPYPVQSAPAGPQCADCRALVPNAVQNNQDELVVVLPTHGPPLSAATVPDGAVPADLLSSPLDLTSRATSRTLRLWDLPKLSISSRVRAAAHIPPRPCRTHRLRTLQGRRDP